MTWTDLSSFHAGHMGSGVFWLGYLGNTCGENITQGALPVVAMTTINIR